MLKTETRSQTYPNAFFQEEGRGSAECAKKGILIALVLSTLISGYRFQESLKYTSSSEEIKTASIIENFGLYSKQEKAHRRIIRIGQTENFNRHDASIWESAVAAGIDPNLWKAVIMVESAGNENAVSVKGAMGLSQLMPETALALGLDKNSSFDPEANLHTGASYLGWLLVRFGGNTELAIAAYNAGPGAVKRTGGIPNNYETKKYVKSVMTLYKYLQKNPNLWWAFERKEIINTSISLLSPAIRLNTSSQATDL